MVANQTTFVSNHQLRLEQVYYEIVTWQTEAGFRAEWICLKCRPSLAINVVPSLSNDAAYETARLQVNEHHARFHAEPSVAAEFEWPECSHLNRG